jgi:transcriptional regulator with XRE-family HTH domain
MTAETSTGQTLGEFLQSRRAKVSPGDVGLYEGRRRRVQGLRREELAVLAGLSTDYYARLEQGRHSHPSPGVLDAVANVLRLSTAERDYLHRLARPAWKPVPGAVVRPETLKVMSALGTTPVLLIGPHMDILASNSAVRQLYADFDALPADERNAIRWMLTSPETQQLHGEQWAGITAELIGMMRLRFGRQPRDAIAQRLVAELSAESEFFRRVWLDQTVATGNRPVKRFHHPEAGTIDVAVEILDVSNSYEQHLVVFVPAPGSADERAWRDVTSRTAGPGVTAITGMTGRG